MPNDNPNLNPALEAHARVVAARDVLLAMWKGQFPSDPACLDSTVCLLDEAIAWMEKT